MYSSEELILLTFYPILVLSNSNKYTLMNNLFFVTHSNQSLRRFLFFSIVAENSVHCPLVGGVKSILEDLDWFSAEIFPAETFRRKSFLNFWLPAGISVMEIYRNSGFREFLISEERILAGKMETLCGYNA